MAVAKRGAIGAQIDLTTLDVPDESLSNESRRELFQLPMQRRIYSGWASIRFFYTKTARVRTTRNETWRCNTARSSVNFSSPQPFKSFSETRELSIPFVITCEIRCFIYYLWLGWASTDADFQQQGQSQELVRAPEKKRGAYSFRDFSIAAIFIPKKTMHWGLSCETQVAPPTGSIPHRPGIGPISLH